MIDSHKFSLDMSTKSQRIRELQTEDRRAKRTDDERTELRELTDAIQGLEVEYRAALVAEAAAGVSVTTEPADPARSTLESRAMVSGILTGVMSGSGPTGAERELQAELGMAANQVPLCLLRPETRAVEHRTSGQTSAPSDVGQSQAPIISYVFPQSAAAYLGVETPSVPVGNATFTVVSTGFTAGTPSQGAAQADSAAVFTATVVDPERIQANGFIRREHRAQLAGMEPAVRLNLSETCQNKFDSEIVGANGFLKSGALTAAPGTDAAAEAEFATYRGLVYDDGVIDGRYATMAADVKLLVGPHTYAHAASKYRGNNADDSALDSLMARSGGVRVSAHIPDPATNDQSLIVVKGMPRRHALAALWDGITIIEDEVTQAKQGEIRYTAIMMWSGLHVLRSDGFVHRKVQVA